MTEWKPLRDAPKNREVLVGWQGKAKHYDFGTRFERYATDDPYWTFRSTVIAEGGDMPTHWCDLDPIPAVVTAEVTFEAVEPDKPSNDLFADMKIGWD